MIGNIFKLKNLLDIVPYVTCLFSQSVLVMDNFFVPDGRNLLLQQVKGHGFT
jgi:hypothetical protein